MPESMSATVSRSVRESENLEVPEHLVTLYNKTAAGVYDHEKDRVARLLCKFLDIFSRDEWDLGLTHLTSHAIKTDRAATDKKAPWRVPIAYAADEKKALEDLKAKGVIPESVSPIVLVRKKDGGFRPCVDYGKVNELVKPGGFPLPRIQDCLDAVAGKSVQHFRPDQWVLSNHFIGARYSKEPLPVHVWAL